MATLTLEMIRKRAEHNEGILHSLEELSLNQLGLVDLGFVEQKDHHHHHHHQQQQQRPCRRSLLPRACRRLRHLSLAGNALLRLPCGPRDLGLCKELRTLNVALNAIEKIEKGGRETGEDEEEEGPLSSCESLQRLDLSGNFISKRTIRETVAALSSAPALENLWLSGCCVAVEWRNYRSFVVGSLPRLKELDGILITAIERIEALEKLPELAEEVVEAARAEKGNGDDDDIDGSDSSSSSSCDLRTLEREADLLESQMKEQEARGEEPKMPWSRAARLLLARETAAGKGSGGGGKPAAAAAAPTTASSGSLFDDSFRMIEPLRTEMPPWPSSDDESDSSGDDDDDEEEEEDGKGKKNLVRSCRRQCDDGAWPFALSRSADGSPSLVLEVALGKALGRANTSGEVELDVRPRFVRVLASGSLLCARLPGKVDRARATARRSLASGRLVVEMPLVDPGAALDESCMREWKGRGGREGGGGAGGRKEAERVAVAAAAAVVVAGEEEDDSDEDSSSSSCSSSPPPL